MTSSRRPSGAINDAGVGNQQINRPTSGTLVDPRFHLRGAGRRHRSRVRRRQPQHTPRPRHRKLAVASREAKAPPIMARCARAASIPLLAPVIATCRQWTHRRPVRLDAGHFQVTLCSAAPCRRPGRPKGPSALRETGDEMHCYAQLARAAIRSDGLAIKVDHPHLRSLYKSEGREDLVQRMATHGLSALNDLAASQSSPKRVSRGRLRGSACRNPP